MNPTPVRLSNRAATILLLAAGCALLLASYAAHATRAADDAAVSNAPKKSESRAEISKAVLDTTALQQGKSANAAVVFDIKPQYHAQSHTPLSEDYKALAARVDPNPAVEVGELVYP